MKKNERGDGPAVEHPLGDLIRMDRIPHIWCPGCGIGSVFTATLSAVRNSGKDRSEFAMVSGIGCTGRGAGYANMDSFHTTHGRAIPFATGIKMAKPDTNVIVFSGDGDLFAIGGNHFIHAARRNMDLTVICVNNLTYGMTGGQAAATTPHMAKSATSVTGNPETPFNLPQMAWASGATYVARWTMVHSHDLTAAIGEAFAHKGFSFIEVLSPCPINYGRRNKEKPLETLRLFQENTIIKNGADPTELDIDYDRGVILGKFVDVDKPSADERYRKIHWPEEEDQAEAS